MRQRHGSSPRVRGTLGSVVSHGALQRFIPACAGNTWPHPAPACCHAVHPRVCGEHSIANLSYGVSSGSSPRVRGTPKVRQAIWRRGRFIPACAGNTPISTGHPEPASVHPRVCGEHVTSVLQNPPWPGSSPRVRGTPSSRARRSTVSRFIPACAGNTWRPAPSSPQKSVHPRVCGEHGRCLVRVHDA